MKPEPVTYGFVWLEVAGEYAHIRRRSVDHAIHSVQFRQFKSTPGRKYGTIFDRARGNEKMSMRQMDIMVRPATADRELRIVVTGELDIATIGWLRAELDTALARHPIAIVVDLSAVTFFSCSAAQTLREAQRRAPESLIVIGAGRPVRRLLEIMQRQPLFDAA